MREPAGEEALRKPTPVAGIAMPEIERQRFRQMAQLAVASEAPLWERFGIVRGARVVDVGAGPGAVIVEIARLVGPEGEVVGIEPDPSARRAATEEIRTHGARPARVMAGTAAATGLPAGRFDVAMIRHVLFHLGAGVRDAIAHATSLLRPGGHLYLVDTSADVPWRQAGFDGDVVDFGAAYLAFLRRRGCDVTVGSRLGELIGDAGLECVFEQTTHTVVSAATLAAKGPMVEAIPAMAAAGFATAADMLRWQAALARAAAMPGLTISVPQFISVGRRPAHA